MLAVGREEAVVIVVQGYGDMAAHILVSPDLPLKAKCESLDLALFSHKGESEGFPLLKVD